jgi:hypothetical protein
LLHFALLLFSFLFQNFYQAVFNFELCTRYFIQATHFAHLMNVADAFCSRKQFSA